MAEILIRERAAASGVLALARQNKLGGFQCVSCAWSKPATPLPFEFCENGAKATAWEVTADRCGPAFFASHTVAELLTWPDYDLENAGRLTTPLRYDPTTDKYAPVSWGDAFAEIGAELRALEDRKSVVFYSSGRSSNEASYLYGLFARLYGNNNLPDSSNMCHETTSVALAASIGSPVGTVRLADFSAADCFLFFGQNPGSNSPRMLHQLQEASKRGAPIIAYNPLRERGLERFTNPQSVLEMATFKETRIASQYHQVKAAGDLAALTGICKALCEIDDRNTEAGRPGVLDQSFIAENTAGAVEFIAWLGQQSWGDIESQSGLDRAALTETATTYAAAKAVIAVYGMGLTQHKAGVETVRMLVNLLLLRGNIGRRGAGICPVRGHSNVQGQRTVGITEKPELVPLEALAKQYAFEPPREAGLNTVEACEAIIDGRIGAFLMLGGNFVRAIPDRDRMERAWTRMRLTVSLATKLNRSHLVHGAVSFLLPVLGRIEIDQQASGPQSLSIEDSLACVHGSRGVRPPAAKDLLSEVRVIAEIAKATLPPSAWTPWDGWADDYSRIRAAIEETYPKIFADYERRMWAPGGFEREVPARERIWLTETKRATFVIPPPLAERADASAERDVLNLITLRSNDQFNTTIYGYSDRFRGIEGTRMVVLANRQDMNRLGFAEGEMVGMRTVFADGFERRMEGFRITAYDIPSGCVGAYYPEANALLPLSHYAEGSKTPAAKSIPVRLFKAGR